MKDELISLKTAKLAKQKGFDLNTVFYWNTDNPLGGVQEIESRYFMDTTSNVLPMKRRHIIEGELSEYESYMSRPINSAPAQSLLQRWLRENYNINIIVNQYDNCVFDYINQIPVAYEEIDYKDWPFDSYEEALEKALFEALKLIKDD